MSARLGAWACFGVFLFTISARSADEVKEVEPTHVVGTLRRLAGDPTSGRAATYAVVVEVKSAGRVTSVAELRLDFGGNAALEKRAAGWVGRRVAAEGKVEYRCVEPDWSSELRRQQLISLISEPQQVLVISVAKLTPVVGR